MRSSRARTRASDLTTLGLGFGHALEVETFKAEQGALFLLHRAGLLALDAGLDQAKAEDRQRAIELSEELGGLALALDQAGAYLTQTRGTLASYQQQYQTHRKWVLEERRGKEHPASVAATWRISFERVEAKNASAAEVICWCSFLTPDAIAEWLLLKAMAKGGEQPQMGRVRSWWQQRWQGTGRKRSKEVERGFDQAVEVLQAYSLLKRDGQRAMLSMHRLVQAVLRDAMTEVEERAWKQRVVLFLQGVCPNVSQVEEWPLCEQWVVHAVVSASWLEEALLQTQAAAWVCNEVGYYLDARGRYQEAEPLYRRALEICEQSLGAGHPSTATSLNNLAALYDTQGKYGEAEPLYKRALEICEQSLGPGHPDTAQSLNNLAGLYYEQGRYAEAELLYQRALEIWEQSLGPTHSSTRIGRENYARLLRELGREEEAAALERENERERSSTAAAALPPEDLAL